MYKEEIDWELHKKLIEEFCLSENITNFTAQYFASGANNVLYRLQNDTNDFVVKIGVNPSYRRLSCEAAILDIVKEITPGLISYTIDEHSFTEILVMPFVDGRHENILSTEMLTTLAQSVAKYHEYPRMIEQLAEENCSDFFERRILPVNSNEVNRPFIDRYKSLFVKAGGLIEYFGREHSKKVLVHGDLIPLNIRFTDNKSVIIIDWEGARYDEPESDIATLFKGWKLDTGQQEKFLAAYNLPVGKNILNFRMVLHYLQVIAWRLSIQLTWNNSDEQETGIISEIEEELVSAENLLLAL